MADKDENAARPGGDGMPLGNELRLPIRKDQATLSDGGVTTPEYDDDAAGTIAWLDYRSAMEDIDEKSWLAEWQYVDYLYQSPSYDRDYRNGNRTARISRFLVAKNRNTMSTQVRRGFFGETSPFILEPRGKLAGNENAELYTDAWTEIFNVLNERADFEYNMTLFIECQVLQGTAIAVPIWETKEEIHKTRVPLEPPVEVDMPVGGKKKIHTMKSDEYKVKEEKVEESWPYFEYRRLGTTLYSKKWRTPGRPDLSGFPRIDIDYVTLTDLQRMRKMDCYKDIPDEEDLKTFFFVTSPKGDAEVGTQTAQAMNQNSTIVMHAAGEQTQASEDPALKPLMKITRWDESRVVEVLCYEGRRKTIRNEEHGIGKQAAGYSATWWNIDNSGYGLGQGRLNAGDQRMEQGTLNEALKMIAFPLNAPLLYDASSGNAPTQDMIVGLGQLLGIQTGPSHDINKAFGFMKMPEVPAEAWKVLELAKAGGEDLVGANATTMQGNLGGAGSSAMRTAAGVNRVGGKADENVSDPITHLEWVIKRWLTFLWERVLEDMPTREIREILSAKFGEAIIDQIDAEEFFNADFNIKILAGTKLAAKAAIMQLIPFLLQIVQQPQLMQWLHEKGWTINFKSIEDIYQRMSELQSWQDIFVKLTDEEKQMVQSQQPGAQKTQAEMALEGEKRKTKLAAVQAEGATEMQNLVVEKALERLGPQELADAEGRLQRNQDMGTLQQGVAGVGE